MVWASRDGPFVRLSRVVPKDRLTGFRSLTAGRGTPWEPVEKDPCPVGWVGGAVPVLDADRRKSCWNRCASSLSTHLAEEINQFEMGRNTNNYNVDSAVDFSSIKRTINSMLKAPHKHNVSNLALNVCN